MSANLVNKETLPWYGRWGLGFGVAAWVVVGFFIAQLLLGLVLGFADPNILTTLNNSTVLLLAVNALAYVLALSVVLGGFYWMHLLVLRKPRVPGYFKRLFGIDQPFRWRSLKWYAVCLGGYLIATLVLSSLATLLPWYNADQTQDVGFKNLTDPLSLVLGFIGLVIIPPIAEELLFRGFMFGRLRQSAGFWFSALFVSVTFGLVHMQWNVGVDVFALSIFLCLLREKTGSLWTSMLLHATKNGVAYFFLFIGPLLGIHIQ